MAEDEGTSLLDMATDADAPPAEEPVVDADTAPNEPALADETADTAPVQDDAAARASESATPANQGDNGQSLLQELAAMKERLARAEGALSVVNAPPPVPEVDPYEAILNDPKFEESFENDPAGTLRAKLAEMATVSRQREAALQDRFETDLRRSDPVYRESQDIYEALSKDPRYANLTEQQLEGAAFAEYQRRQEAAANGTVQTAQHPQPRPPVSGAPARKVVTPKKPMTPIEKYGEAMFRAMGGIQGNDYMKTLNG